MVRFSKKSVTKVSSNKALKNSPGQYLARKLWPSRLYTGPDLWLGWLRKKLAIFRHWFQGDTLSGSRVSYLPVIIVLNDSVLLYGKKWTNRRKWARPLKFDVQVPWAKTSSWCDFEKNLLPQCLVIARWKTAKWNIWRANCDRPGCTPALISGWGDSEKN